MNYPILALIIANVIWGAAVPIFKYSLQNIPPFTLLFIRFFFAGLLFLPAAIAMWQKLSKKDLLEIILAALLGFTVAISLLFLGLSIAPSINHPIIMSAGPIVLYFIAITILKEKAHPKMLIGSAVSLLGVVLIVLSPLLFSGGTINSGEITGNIFFVVSMVASVVYTIISRSILKRHNTYQVTALIFLIAAATYLPFAHVELATWNIGQLDSRGWLGIVYGIFFSSALAYWFFHWGIARVKAQEIGIFTYIDPIVTILIAIPLLGEYPTVHYVAGAILVFAGIFIAEGRIHWHPLHRLKN